VAQRNDQIFQLSLTEIAFTITFLLLLLLGYLVFKEETERQAAEAELAKVQSADRATAALHTAKSEISALLKGAGIANPDEFISSLVSAADVRGERDQLRQRVDDLDAKLTALEELKTRLEQAALTLRPEIIQDEVLSALALQDQVRAAVEQSITEPLKPTNVSASSSVTAKPASVPAVSSSTSKSVRDKQALTAVRQALATTSELRRQLKEKLAKELPVGKEDQTIQEVVLAAKGYGDLTHAGQSPETMKKENSDLRGQVAFLKNRLDARGGRDYPPCWADETGKVEFLFSVEVRPDAVAVAPAWPARREAAARVLPGIDAVLSGPHSNQSFISKIQGIFNWSKAQDPECRHYVQLKSTITDAVQSDRARLMVENFFYKVESRR